MLHYGADHRASPVGHGRNTLSLEPDEHWKQTMRKTIELSMLIMVNDAKTVMETELSKGPIGEQERKVLAREYSETMAGLRLLAQEQYTEALNRERNLRKWAADQPVTSAWSEALEKEQQALFEHFERNGDIPGPSYTDTSKSDCSASGDEEEEEEDREAEPAPRVTPVASPMSVPQSPLPANQSDTESSTDDEVTESEESSTQESEDDDQEPDTPSVEYESSRWQSGRSLTPEPAPMQPLDDPVAATPKQPPPFWTSSRPSTDASTMSRTLQQASRAASHFIPADTHSIPVRRASSAIDPRIGVQTSGPVLSASAESPRPSPSVSPAPLEPDTPMVENTASGSRKEWIRAERSWTAKPRGPTRPTSASDAARIDVRPIVTNSTIARVPSAASVLPATATGRPSSTPPPSSTTHLRSSLGRDSRPTDFRRGSPKQLPTRASRAASRAAEEAVVIPEPVPEDNLDEARSDSPEPTPTPPPQSEDEGSPSSSPDNGSQGEAVEEEENAPSTRAVVKTPSMRTSREFSPSRQGASLDDRPQENVRSYDSRRRSNSYREIADYRRPSPIDSPTGLSRVREDSPPPRPGSVAARDGRESVNGIRIPYSRGSPGDGMYRDRYNGIDPWERDREDQWRNSRGSHDRMRERVRAYSPPPRVVTGDRQHERSYYSRGRSDSHGEDERGRSLSPSDGAYMPPYPRSYRGNDRPPGPVRRRSSPDGPEERRRSPEMHRKDWGHITDDPAYIPSSPVTIPTPSASEAHLRDRDYHGPGYHPYQREYGYYPPPSYPPRYGPQFHPPYNGPYAGAPSSESPPYSVYYRDGDPPPSSRSFEADGSPYIPPRPNLNRERETHTPDSSYHPDSPAQTMRRASINARASPLQHGSIPRQSSKILRSHAADEPSEELDEMDYDEIRTLANEALERRKSEAAAMEIERLRKAKEEAEEALRLEKLAADEKIRQEKLEASRIEKEAKLKEEAAAAKEESIKREKLAVQREKEEVAKREAMVKQREQEMARREAATRAQEAEARRIHDEALRKADEARRAEAAARALEEEKQRQRDYQQREGERREAEIYRKKQEDLFSAAQAQRQRQDSGASEGYRPDPAWASPPKRSGSTASGTTSSTDRSSTSSRGSAASGWSNSTNATSTSASSTGRSSTTPTGTTKPGGPGTSWSNPPMMDPAEWRRRQEELAKKQQEQFRKDQERQDKAHYAKTTKPLTKEQLLELYNSHTQQWKRIAAMEQLSWNDFPWPVVNRVSQPEDISTVVIEAYVLSHLHPDSMKPTKERIKEYIRRWHPDRFDTKYLARVSERERDKVKLGAGIVTRGLNELLTRTNDNDRDVFA